MNDEIGKRRTIAIVGASSDRKKFGNKAVRAFRDGGWTVYPVNPNEGTVEGITAFSSVSDLPPSLDRVAMYVPPAIGVQLLDDIAAATPEEFFLNPGSESPELLKQAKDRGLDPIVACSIVDIGRRPDMYGDT
jgi:uncharacterized protein